MTVFVQSYPGPVIVSLSVPIADAIFWFWVATISKLMTPTLEGSFVKTDIFLAPESKVITELSYAEPSDFYKV